jgi:hypothetical protein
MPCDDPGSKNIGGWMTSTTYLLTPWSIFLLEKPNGSHLVKKLPEFYGTQRFIT